MRCCEILIYQKHYQKYTHVREFLRPFLWLLWLTLLLLSMLSMFPFGCRASNGMVWLNIDRWCCSYTIYIAGFLLLFRYELRRPSNHNGIRNKCRKRWGEERHRRYHTMCRCRDRRCHLRHRQPAGHQNPHIFQISQNSYVCCHRGTSNSGHG